MVGWGDMDANSSCEQRCVLSLHRALPGCITFSVIGFWGSQTETLGIGPILAWADCRFRRPLDYPDTVSIGIANSGCGE